VRLAPAAGKMPFAQKKTGARGACRFFTITFAARLCRAEPR